MNARDNTPIRTKIAAYLDAVRESTAPEIAKATGHSERPSVVVKELNAMRTDALVECEKRKKGMVYWLAVPIAQIESAGTDSLTGPASDLPECIKPGSRSAQIWHALRDGKALTARQLASALTCATGTIDPTLNLLIKAGTISRSKTRGNPYVYHRPLEQVAPEPAAAVKESLTAPDPAPVTPSAASAPDISAHFNGFDVTKLPPILISCVARLWPGSEGMFWEQSLERMPDRIAEVVENMNALLAERAEAANQFAILKARHDSYEHAIGEIHRSCSDAGIPEGHVAERVRQLAESLASILGAAPAQAEEAVDVHQAAKGYLLKVPKRRPRVVTKADGARKAALAAARSAGRADVLALVPIGSAVRGSEWRDA